MSGLPLNTAGVLFTAGGKNKDIRAALDAALTSESSTLTVVTTTVGSPVVRTARAARHPVVVAYPPPSGRDGFLATNSLITFCSVVYRAYHDAGLIAARLPATWAEVFNPEEIFDSERARLLVDADSLLVLHGVDTRAAAVDLESKCSEAALAHVQLADYRNFAHGRHHWLARRPSTLVVSLESASDSAIATRTLRLLPSEIPTLRARVPQSGPIAAISALGAVFELVRLLGRQRDIDPGRPSVPEFGRKLYSLGAISSAVQAQSRSTPELHATTAIARKARVARWRVNSMRSLEVWEASYARALATLADANFTGIVFDYDGTLVDHNGRFEGLATAVGAELSRLLAAGIPIGIATGRGKSVASALRSGIQETHWPRVIVGYYNGGEIARLDNDQVPDGRAEVSAALSDAYSALLSAPALVAAAQISPRLPQITIQPQQDASAEFVWDLAAGIIAELDAPGVRVVHSSHSIDVLAPGVGKLNVVSALRKFFDIPETSAILHVGDRGQWPGNDFELLRGLHAVSVEHTSADPSHAWNLARPGVHGVSATLELLPALRPDGNRFRIDVNRMLGDHTES